MKRLGAAIIAILLVAAGCDDDNYKPVPPVENNQNNDSTDIFNNINSGTNSGTNNQNNDHKPPDDSTDIDEDGPDIVITSPEEGQLINTKTIQVKATITSEISTVDFGSVTVYMEGREYTMTADPQQEDGFTATLSMEEVPDGTVILRVSAKDIEGRKSYKDRTILYDSGPRFTIYSPEPGGRYHGGTTLLFAVYDTDGVDPDSVTATIADKEIELTKVTESSDKVGGLPLMIGYSGDVVFDDSQFDQPLTGTQRITITARNGLGTESSSYVDFEIDNEGPSINVKSHSPGDLIGGILQLEVEITDPAGVLPSSVYATIGNNDVEYELPLTKEEGSNIYTGSFDTSVLPHNWVWPAIQIFASDTLGNEASLGFEVALDNTPPVASLDPPTLRYARTNGDGQLECSWPIDPVGVAVPDDRSRVPQVFWLRAQVEDFGNYAPGAVWSPIAKVDKPTVDLYILDDTSVPLVVDTNGDGICDDINPNLVPTIHLTGNPQETLKIDMVPIDPYGQADFTPDPSLQGTGCMPGDEEDHPDPLCSATEGDMTVAIFYTTDRNEPAIYTIPPVDTGDELTCSGIQFDAVANNISEGWLCVAVKAVDNVGNVTVSAPLRLCLDADQDGSPSECGDPDTAPRCTGTLDTSTNPPTVTDTPCTPLTFPQGVIRRID